jgi:hypothetical protein
MAKEVTRPRRQRQAAGQRLAVARAALASGGAFATSVGGVLTAVAIGGVDNLVAFAALAAVCLITGLTMGTAAAIARAK